TGFTLIDTSPVSGSNDYLEGVAMAYPASPFTATMLATPPLVNNASPSLNPEIGFGIFQNTTGGATQLLGFRLGSGLQWTIMATNWTNATTYDSYALNNINTVTGGALVWLQFQDNGTAYIFSASVNGVTFIPFLTQTKSSGFMAGNYNYFGLAIDANGSTVAPLSVLS